MKKSKIFTAPLVVLMWMYFAFLKADILVDSTENYRVYQLDDGTYKAVVEPLDYINFIPVSGAIEYYYEENWGYRYDRLTTAYCGNYEDYSSYQQYEKFRAFFEYDISLFISYPTVRTDSVFMWMFETDVGQGNPTFP